MKKNKIYIINCLLVLVIFTLVLVIKDFAPFGGSSISIHDGKMQYQPFLYDLIMSIRTGTFSLFRFNTMFGSPVFLSYMYYLSSPLNMIALVTDNSYMMYYLVIMFKLLIGSICSTYYFDKTFKNDKMNTICTLSYLFSGWFLAYYFSILWLDIFGLFPLMQYYLERMLKDKKISLGYIIVLGLIIVCNFHLSIYVCFYILFYFIIYHIKNKTSIKEKIYSLEKMFICTLLSFLLIMVFIYPVFIDFTSKIGFGQVNSMVIWRSDLLIFNSLISGYSSVNLHGFAMCFNCSISMFFLINNIYYFFNKDINLKKRLISLGILLLSVFLIYFYYFTYFVSGFYAPVCFNYRYSFIISFLLIIFGMKNYLKYGDKYDIKRLVISSVIVLGIILINKIFGDLSNKLMIYNLILLVLYFILLLRKKNLFIVLLVIIESFFNVYLNLYNTELIEEYNYNENASHMYISDEQMVYGNRQYLDNSTSMSSFSSTNYARSLNFLGTQGYETDGKHILYNYKNDLLFNMLFNIDDNNKLNKVYGVSKDILNYKNSGYFLDNHEEIANLMTGNDYDYFDVVSFDGEDIGDGFYKYKINKDGYYSYINEDRIKYIITDDVIYAFNDSVDYLDDYLNDREYRAVLYVEIISFEFKKDDEIIVYYKNDEEPNLFFYQVNDNYNKVYNQLKKNEIVYKEFRDGYIDGYISLDEEQIIFSNIVYDEDWEVYLDGERVEPIVVMDTFIGIEASSGEHKIVMEYKYHNYGSLIVSMTTMCGLLFYYLYRKSKENE